MTRHYCGDPAIKYSHLQQQQRAAQVDARRRNPTEMGCHGTSWLVQSLPYVDYNNIQLLPFAHTVLLGVLKDFWKHMLGNKKKAGQAAAAGAISLAARAAMAARAAQISPTADFGRPYRCIVKQRGEWTMEDWLHWSEVWAIYVLAPYKDRRGRVNEPLPAYARDMWQLLRSIVLTLLRPNAILCTEAGRDGFQQDLLRYGQLVEEHFGIRGCKYNLHELVCR